MPDRFDVQRDGNEVASRIRSDDASPSNDKNLGTFSPTVDVQHHQCTPCESAMPSQRGQLINMKCRYYTQAGGCQRPDCRFLHEEDLAPEAVFYDDTHMVQTPTAYAAIALNSSAESEAMDALDISTSMQHGMADWWGSGFMYPQTFDCDYYQSFPPCDAMTTGYFYPVESFVKKSEVRIYVGNVPSDFGEDRIRELVASFGEILLIDIQASQLINRRRSVFIHMTDLEEAEAVVALLNNTVVDEAELYANIKSCTSRWVRPDTWNPFQPAYVEMKPTIEETTTTSLVVGALPPLIEVDESEYIASEAHSDASPTSVITDAPVTAMPDFALPVKSK